MTSIGTITVRRTDISIAKKFGKFQESLAVLKYFKSNLISFGGVL